MAVNQFDTIDVVTEATNRLTEQFKDKPIISKAVNLMLGEWVEIQAVLQDLQQLRSIDTAVGVQLDIIGEIVGRPRGLVTSELFYYFGFENSLLGESYSSLSDTTRGAQYYSLNAPTGISRAPSDDEYRLILKAKIIANQTLSRPEDVIAAYKFLFEAGTVTLTETDPAKVSIGIGKILSNVERGLLFDLGGAGNLLPKTVGVSYTYSEFNSDRVFATEGFPNAMGTGDLNDATVGGFLSNLIT